MSHLIGSRAVAKSLRPCSSSLPRSKKQTVRRASVETIVSWRFASPSLPRFFARQICPRLLDPSKPSVDWRRRIRGGPEDAGFDRHLQGEPHPDRRRDLGRCRRAPRPPGSCRRRRGVATSVSPPEPAEGIATAWFSHRQWGRFRTPGRGTPSLWSWTMTFISLVNGFRL